MIERSALRLNTETISGCRRPAFSGFGEKFLFAVAEKRGLFEVLLVDSGFFGLPDPDDLIVDLDVGW
jgi:hypothetical protein